MLLRVVETLPVFCRWEYEVFLSEDRATRAFLLAMYHLVVTSIQFLRRKPKQVAPPSSYETTRCVSVPDTGNPTLCGRWLRDMAAQPGWPLFPIDYYSNA